MAKKIEVVRPKFKKLSDLSSLQSIAESDKIKHLTDIQGMKVVILGGASSAKTSWYVHWGYEAVPLECYKGTLEPLSYHDSLDAVQRGERPRGYAGHLAYYKGKPWVLTGEQLEIVPIEMGKQIELF